MLTSTNRLREIIGTNGHRPRVIDLATDLWSKVIRKAYGLTPSREVAFSKSTGIQPLPIAPDREPGEWEKKTTARNERDMNPPTDNKPVVKQSIRRNPNKLRQIYIPKAGNNFVGLTVIHWKDGAVTVRPERTTPSADYTAADAGSDADRRELLQLALDHLQHTSAGKKGENKMEKSQVKMPQMLIRKVPKKAAERTPRPPVYQSPIFKSKQTEDEPQDGALRMLVRKPKAVITKSLLPVVEKIEQPEQPKEYSNFQLASMPGLDRVAVLSKSFDAQQAKAIEQVQNRTQTAAEQVTDFYGQFGKTLDQTMTLQEFNQLSGHQRRALSCGLNPYADDIPFDQLSNSELVELAQSIKRKIYGIPEPKPDTCNVRYASQFD